MLENQDYCDHIKAAWGSRLRERDSSQRGQRRVPRRNRLSIGDSNQRILREAGLRERDSSPGRGWGAFERRGESRRWRKSFQGKGQWPKLGSEGMSSGVGLEEIV